MCFAVKGKAGKRTRFARPPSGFLLKIPAELFNSDGTAGAGIHASAAAHAGIFDDHSLVAFDFDRFGGAGVNTSTATGAGIFVNFSSHFLFLLIIWEWIPII